MKGQKTEYATVYRVIDICNEILSWILMVILVCLFCYGTYGIGDSYVLEQDAMPQHYEVYRPTEEDSLSFEELQAKNSDVCGWITIYGTHVDYPVVRGADNSVYLMRDPEGNYRMSGSIFMDCANQREFTDFNTILYGHHMDGGAMFGDLDKYLSDPFADSHLYGNIYADGKDYGLELFAFLEVDAYNTDLYVTPVDTTDARMRYLQEIREKAMWYRDIDITEEDRLVVMSTCTENITNGRHLLIGRLTSQTYEDTYQVIPEKKEVQQVDRIDWKVFWKTSAKSLGVILLLLISILILIAVMRTGRNTRRKN